LLQIVDEGKQVPPFYVKWAGSLEQKKGLLFEEEYEKLQRLFLFLGAAQPHTPKDVPPNMTQDSRILKKKDTQRKKVEKKSPPIQK